MKRMTDKWAFSNRKNEKNRRKNQKRFMKTYCLLGLIVWVAFAYQLMFHYIPDEIYLEEVAIGQNMIAEQETVEWKFAQGMPITVTEQETIQPVFGTQGVTEQGLKHPVISCRLFHLIPVKQVQVHYQERKTVLPAGTNVGIYLKNKGVLVVSCASFTDQNGALISPAAYRLKSGDMIMRVNDAPMTTKEQLIEAVAQSGGRQLTLEVIREQELIQVAVTPEVADDGIQKIGVWVRDDIAGIGTMTYVTSENQYGALGHGVNDIDTGELIQLENGEIYETQITGISKGKRGMPGEVTGTISFQKSEYLGTVKQNSDDGIYGQLEQRPDSLSEVSEIPIGYKQEIEKGTAHIISSVEGARSAYEIEIEQVDFYPKEENKGILYRVTDNALLDMTGGIVQGMFTSYNGSNNRKASKIKGFLMF